jgi:WXG100 family type VII secretion target
MGAGEVLGVWDKINSWMSPLSGAVDAILRPLVQPLADQFDSITGDSEAVRSTAERWRDMAAKTRAIGQFQASISQGTAGSWQGEAADAFQATVAELVAEIESMGEQFDDVAEFLDDAAMEVETAEQAVEDIIRELIEWALLSLAVGAALSIVTVGASAAAGAAAAAARAAVAGSRIATVVAKVAKALSALAKALKALKKMKGLEGFVARALVKKVVLKPVVSAGTGLTADPVGAGRDALVGGLSDIAADEYDDQVAGDDGVQTPLRDGLDEPIGPLADATRGPAEAIDDLTREIDERTPSFPGS